MTTTTISAQEELANINTIQNAIRETGAQWTAGTTSVSNLSAEDKLIMAGGRISPHDASIPLISIPEGAGEFLPTFDWRSKDNENWMTPIKDQGICGSCWAFSASGVIEAGFNIYNNDPYLNIDISEQHLVSDCCNAGNCRGGWPDLALRYARDTGVPDESCFPYIQENTACTPCSDWQDRVYQITGYTQADHTTDSYKQALIDYGPIASCILVPDDWYYYKSGIYEPTLALDVSEWATHAISIVGWDDSDECWFIRNSWGQHWGENGYGRVKYGNIEKWGYAYAVTGIEYGTNLSPTAYASATPTNGTAPLTVQFTGEGTDPDGTIESYEWNLGDGNFSYEQNPVHQYPEGTYNPFLTVCDDRGAQDTDISLTISVTKPELTYIVATTVTATPMSCKEPCNITIYIKWKNTGTTIESFTPGYIINGTLYPDEPATLDPGQIFAMLYTVYDLPSGNYEICPTNN